MPSLTRWFVKTSFIYPILALVTGLLPVYIHLFVLSWLTQLIFGMMYWMFPNIPTKNRVAAKRLVGGLCAA